MNQWNYQIKLKLLRAKKKEKKNIHCRINKWSHKENKMGVNSSLLSFETVLTIIFATSQQTKVFFFNIAPRETDDQERTTYFKSLNNHWFSSAQVDVDTDPANKNWTVHPQPMSQATVSIWFFFSIWASSKTR